jgi:hypothetical protein
LEAAPDAAARADLARDLGLLALEAYVAKVVLTPWMDGAQLEASWSARISQTCGVSLEAFETDLANRFCVRLLPAGSPNAPEESPEVVLDLDAEDPPERLEGGTIDVWGYLVEHLALDIDPFPRRPGAVFEPPPAPEIISPFAVLRGLKDPES